MKLPTGLLEFLREPTVSYGFPCVLMRFVSISVSFGLFFKGFHWVSWRFFGCTFCGWVCAI